MLHKNVEKAFVEYIGNIADFDTLDEIQLIAKKQIKELNIEEINKLRKEIKKLEAKEKEALSFYIGGRLDFDNFMEIKTSIAKEQKNITVTLERLESYVDEEITIKKENIIKSLKENWELLDNTEKRRFLINFVDKITVINHREQGKRDGHMEICDVEFSVV